MPDYVWLLLIILIVVVIWRGPKILPEWGAMLGRGVREARVHATKGLDDDKTQQTLGDGGVDDDLRTAAQRDPTGAPRG